jgi:hypothetical protein
MAQPESQVAVKGDIFRRLGFGYEVTITNNSGKDAWVHIAPHRIITIKAAGIDKIGSLEVDIKHNPRTQKRVVPAGESWHVSLDTNDIYYSAFFDFKDGVYKSNIIDILINTRRCNLVLLPKHVNAARRIEFTQKIEF